MVKSPTNWETVEREIGREIAESSDPFSSATIAQIADFLSYIRNYCPLPSEISKGFQATMCFSWQNIQVEVLGDHLEFYQFRDRQTDIQHFSHNVGEPLPPALLAKLPVC